jgi:hypothetical protein
MAVPLHCVLCVCVNVGEAGDGEGAREQGLYRERKKP